MRPTLEDLKNAAGDYMAYADGGYPIAYIVADGGEMCAACANGGNGSRAAEDLDADCPDDDQWRVVDWTICYAGEAEVRCDHCDTIIAFGEDDDNA